MRMLGKLRQLAVIIALSITGTAALATSVPIPEVEGPLPDSAHQGTLVWHTDKLGYRAEEYLISGKADVYDAVDMADAPNMLTRDNIKDMAKRDSYVRPVLHSAQPYVTRLIVYKPDKPAHFSGNVILEVTHPARGGNAIVWSQLSGYFTQHGDVYVSIALPATFDNLRLSNPSRYGRVSAADPSQLWGMIAQTGALIRSGSRSSPLHGYDVKYLFLTGYSFTGATTSTFADFHHDAARFDGHAIFSGYLPMANTMYVRPLDVPVIRVNTQGDFNSFHGVNNRGEDSDTAGHQYRLWEVTGASHVNSSPTVEPRATPWVPPAPVTEAANLPQFSAQQCSSNFPSGFEPDTLPLNYVMISAFEHMYSWVRGGKPPPRAPRLQVDADNLVVTDSSGNAVGGLRLPEITVPAASYGSGPGDNCFLFGYRLPYDGPRMTALYGVPANYLEKLDASAKELVKQQWLRPQDADAIVKAEQKSAIF